MKKALRYLKPFWLSVLAIVALVITQVQFELALPDYMSSIVTYGIQYGGITDPVPEALSKETYEHIQYFMDDAQKNTLNSSYTEVQQGDSSYTEKYPAVKEDSIYLLSSDTNELQEAIRLPFLAAGMLKNEDILKAMNIDDASQVYAMIEMSPDMSQKILEGIQQNLAGYTEDNLKAAQIMMVKQEYVSLGMDTESMQSGYIFSQGIKMLLIALAGSLAAVASAYLASRTATGACRNMRNDIFRKVESFSNEEFAHFSTASLITRTTNDVQQVQNLLTMLLRIVLFAPCMGLISLIKVLRYRNLASILGYAILVMIALMIVILMTTMPKFKIAQKLVDSLNLVTREQLDGMLVIRAFNNEDSEEKRFDQVNTDITKLNIFLNRVMSIVQPMMQLIMSGVSVAIIWFGARAVDLGTMQIGDMMAFLQYSTHVLISFMIVAMIFVMIPRSAVSANRIFEILETEPVIKDKEDPLKLPEENSPIVFDHVCFRYPRAEQNVLEDITFTANPGETVAFIGSTGSGKSTLINLLPRFFDVTEGKITVGGVDIREVSQHDLRDKIGYIPQKGILFSGTIESNLRYADEHAEEEALENALRISQAKEFVDRMPDGIKEAIAQGGTNVSGGQKQRLSIARALTKKAQIFIFDDTFSALDYATDARLREALAKMKEETKATVLIVAQRISTIMNADQIVVLDQGKIAGIGKHNELMKDCPVYQEIARSQLSKEELGE